MKLKKNIIPLILAIFICGCSTTKRLADGEVLYTGVKKMKVESVTDEKVPGSVKSAVKNQLNVKPNNPLISPYIRTPLPIGLWAWNYLYTEKRKGFKWWLYKRFAKQPVLMSDLQPDLRLDVVSDVLDNLGYFGSWSDYEIIPKKNPKKARVSYHVHVPEEWRYSNVDFPPVVNDVTAMISSMQESTNITPGSQYNVDTLARERVRITNHLRRNGYYYFRPDYLDYLADTTRKRYEVDLRMKTASGIPAAIMQSYSIGEIFVDLYNPEGGPQDSLEYDGIKIRYQKPLKIRPKVLARRLRVATGDPSDVDDINSTLTNLTKLGIFRYVNLSVTPLDSLQVSRDMIFPDGLRVSTGNTSDSTAVDPAPSDGRPGVVLADTISRTTPADSSLTINDIFPASFIAGDLPYYTFQASDSLDMLITAAFDTPIEAEFEADFASKSNSYIGPGAIFSVRHKNLFRGGEILSVRLNGSYEWQTGNTRGQANTGSINSYELGATASLTFPRLVAPGFIPRSQRYDSRTTYQVGASILNRPKFFTTASYNFSSSYDIQFSPNSFHNITLFKFVYNRLLKTTLEFEQVMDDNPTIAQSFESQLIPSASYTYTYDKTYGKKTPDRLIFQGTFMTAGNILSGAWGIFGAEKPKKLFGVPFSQFVKLTTELRHYYRMGLKTTIASRIIVGAGYPYGNSNVLPYSEQYYVGGANSIRAFTVRSLGPGSYRPSEYDTYGYFDQMGEFKLEANIEYRINIAGGLNGAVFLDAGNVWLLHKDPQRPGAKLNFKRMWDQIALGTGVGLRYDLTFLVIRADLGIGLHVPYANTERSGYYNIDKFKDGLGFHLAIGYPF